MQNVDEIDNRIGHSYEKAVYNMLMKLTSEKVNLPVKSTSLT